MNNKDLLFTVCSSSIMRTFTQYFTLSLCIIELAEAYLHNESPAVVT